MLSILLNWLYMGGMIYVCGCFLMQLFTKLVHKEQSVDFVSVMFAGIVFTTCYAQVFSIFYKVSFLANVMLIIFACIYCIVQRKYMSNRIILAYQNFKGISIFQKRIAVIGLFLVIVAFSMSSAGPAKLIDTDWYHAQTIRWIEEYGCVKGVANLFYELGFNSAQHYFDALFSMKCFIGQSLRGTGGFFGLLIFLHGFLRLLSFKNRKNHIADALAIWEIAYSIIITAFYADPYTDTMPNMIILFILTEWMSMLEKKEEDVEKFALLCILGVFATLAKTSAAMVVLLSIYPIYLLIKKKRKKEILLYLIIGFTISIPYLATNIITTGYPIILLTELDFIPVKWKIDSEVINYMRDNMIQFSRMPLGEMGEALDCGLRWIPEWFRNESISHQVLYISILVLVLFDLYFIIKNIITWIVKKQPLSDGWMILPRICIYIGLTYWLLTIPQVKYCWSYLIFPVAVIPVYYFERNVSKKKIFSKALLALAAGLLILYTGFYGLRTIKYMVGSVPHNLVMQQDYENHVFNTVEKNGHTFYTRIEDGDIVCGYYIFPYLDNDEHLDELVIGDDLGDGFYFE